MNDPTWWRPGQLIINSSIARRRASVISRFRGNRFSRLEMDVFANAGGGGEKQRC